MPSHMPAEKTTSGYQMAAMRRKSGMVSMSTSMDSLWRAGGHARADNTAGGRAVRTDGMRQPAMVL